MFRKASGLSELQARKQLLIVESELNRARLVADWSEMRDHFEHLGGRITRIGTVAESAARIASSAAGIFRGIFSRRKAPDGPIRKASLIYSVFNGARAGMSLWSSLRSHSR